MRKKDADDSDFYERMTPEEKAEFDEDCQKVGSGIIIFGAISALFMVIWICVKVCTFIWNLIESIFGA